MGDPEGLEDAADVDFEENFEFAPVVDWEALEKVDSNLRGSHGDSEPYTD